MMVDLFDQFISPTLLGIPLIMLALTLPWTLFPSSPPLWLNTRLTNVQLRVFMQFTHQMLQPLNQPGHKWALILTSLMLYLITLNLLGMLPYTYTPTAQLSHNLGLAVPIWLATVITGMRTNMTNVLAHFLPPATPSALIPALVIIETISLFIRPLALGVRLTANLTAGHLLMYLMGAGAFALSSITPPVAGLTFVIMLLLTLLEFAVAMIQAYVFVLLLSLYLQENV
uniref:ATP synthase subunit a n=1 Tax=Entelurus aequoreus TaxID=161455 RepID=A0A6B9SDQ8_9TELE|nr:ATP synthase F0 subunit 6 [Entelurus aequoreus]